METTWISCPRTASPSATEKAFLTQYRCRTLNIVIAFHFVFQMKLHTGPE